MISIQEIISYLEKYFPKNNSYDWDNVGINVGGFDKKIENILISVDINNDIVDEAIKKQCQVIISHHPLIFQGIKSIRSDLPDGELIYKLIKNDIVHYCMHTNADISEYGNNYYISKLLKLEDVKGLSFFSKDEYYKIVVYVPKSHADKVRDIMAKEGAGHIGNYSHCFFKVEGIGSFKPLEGSNPFIGNIGEVETVDEIRIETIVNKKDLKKVIRAMEKGHPYEEVAYDIYKLENEIKTNSLGIIGKRKMSANELINEIKNIFGCRFVKAMILKESFEKIAVCSGSGKDLIKDASFAGADIFITADITHHSMLQARDLGLSIIDIGHFYSERVFIDSIYKILSKHEKKNMFNIFKSEIITDYLEVY
ncbi:Nif3-like dinuclear metal center hexameric protein [Caldicellulosiruptoraceae bacterium PP1]